jgi:hypothetical protein
MADVEISFGDDNTKTAILLLAAAEELGRGPREVRTTIGSFIVDAEIAAQAGLIDKPKKAKKTPAKKAAKKTAAKKSTAKE